MRQAGDRTPGAHAHRARRGRRPRRGPRRRRRRLPGQAVRPARAAGAAARPAAPGRPRRGRRCASPTSRWTPTRTRCTAAARRIELSRTEFTLLELFMRHPRQVLTRTQIFESVWGYDLGATSNALGVYIGYLRRKTEAGRRAAAAAHGPRRGLRPARGLTVALRAQAHADVGAHRGRHARARVARRLRGRARRSSAARSTTRCAATRPSTSASRRGPRRSAARAPGRAQRRRPASAARRATPSSCAPTATRSSSAPRAAPRSR